MRVRPRPRACVAAGNSEHPPPVGPHRALDLEPPLGAVLAAAQAVALDAHRLVVAVDVAVGADLVFQNGRGVRVWGGGCVWGVVGMCGCVWRELEGWGMG